MGVNAGFVLSSDIDASLTALSDSTMVGFSLGAMAADHQLVPNIDKIVSEFGWTAPWRAVRQAGAGLPAPGASYSDDVVLEVDAAGSLAINAPGHEPVSEYSPTTGQAGPREWKQWIFALNKIGDLDSGYVVPGHGRACGRKAVARHAVALDQALSRGASTM